MDAPWRAHYALALGKNANCQTLVSRTLGPDGVSVVVGLRLFLSESWISGATRLSGAGVPEDCRTHQAEIALAEIERMQTAGVRFGCVLANAGYGLSASFRQALSERALNWTVGIPLKQKVYSTDVAMIFPVAVRHTRYRPRHSRSAGG